MTLPQRGRFARASALGTVNCVPYFPTGRWGKQNPLEMLKVFLRIQITVTLSNPLGRRHSGGGSEDQDPPARNFPVPENKIKEPLFKVHTLRLDKHHSYADFAEKKAED